MLFLYALFCCSDTSSSIDKGAHLELGLPATDGRVTCWEYVDEKNTLHDTGLQ